MPKVVTSYNNFARAKVDHDIMGRFDLPLYNTGADVFENFISNFKGNAIFDTGFLSQFVFQDCEFVEFKFGTTQNYLCCFYASTIRFLSFDTNGVFGWVLDGSSNILEVANPYTLAQCRELDYSQNSDVMVVTHPSHEPRKLIRTSANSFTFEVFARLNDPFPLTWQATKVITGITQANPAVVTCVAHGYSTGDRVLIDGVSGMTEINKYTARVTVINANSFSLDLNTTSFTAYSSGGTAAKVLTGDYPACNCFYKGRLFYAATPAKPTKVWFSTSAAYDDFTVPVTFTATSAFNFVIADITQKIEWLFPGDNSLIAGSTDGIVAINGGGVNTAITASSVQANITSAEPTNGVYPLKKDGHIFYVGRTGRNIYFFKYDIITESFLSRDANITSYDITAGGMTKLRFKKDKNDLIYALRGDGELCTMNFSARDEENIIGWHNRTTTGTFEDVAVIGDNNGDPQMIVLAKRPDGNYYIELKAHFVEFTTRDKFITGDDDAAKELDDEAYYRYIAEQYRDCVYMDGAFTYEDLRSTTITYNSGAGTITASAASFSSGDVGKHIVYRTLTGYESGRFEITGYTSTTVVSVSVLQEPTTNSYSSWYLSFDTISGLSQFNGFEVGVVTDGGFLEDATISGGTLTVDSQTTSVVIGYRYTGLIKTFCLGFQYGAANTQVLLKNIVRAGVRTVASAGGRIGSSPYHMEPIHELTLGDLNYLPPLPIDGTKMIDYSDDSEEDKYLYVMQDVPHPFHICNVPVEAQYAVSA